VTAKLVSALVISRLDYCNAILAGLLHSYTAAVQRVLNCAAQLVYGLWPRDHVTKTLMQLRWLPVHEHINFKLCMFVYKSLSGNAPTYIANKLQPVAQLHCHATLHLATNNDLIVPPCWLHFGECAFTVATPRLWKSLLADVGCATSVAVFKKKLKTFMF